MVQDITSLSDDQLLALAGKAPDNRAETGVRNALESAFPGIRITGGGRSVLRNAEVGGVDNSNHLTGNAIDFAPPPGVSIDQVRQALAAQGVNVTEAIDETKKTNGTGPHYHVAWEGEVAPQESRGLEGLSDEALLSLNTQDSIDPAGAESLIMRSGLTEDNPFVITDETPRELLNNLTKGTWISVDGETHRLSGQPYINNGSTEGDQAVAGGNAFLHRPGIEDTARAFTTATAEQVPFLDEAAAGVGGLLSGEGYDVARQRQMDTRAIDNESNGLARDLGGIAGFGLGLAAPAGGFINAGKGVAAQTARAAIFGGGTGALYGAGNTEGDLGERAEAGILGAALGATTGGVAQRFLAPATASAAPSAARQLSREGVNLTPGQMFGGVVNTLEEVGQSVPLLRESIQGARRRGLEDFNRAVANRALKPIGGSVPRGQAAGYDLVGHVRTQISDAYDKALGNVQVAPDSVFRSDLSRIMSGARLTPQAATQVQNVLDNTLTARFTGAVDGPTFKSLDEEIGAAARAAGQTLDGGPTARYTERFLSDVQDAMDQLLERVDPQAAKGKQAADEAWANFVRLRDATATGGTASKQGVFTAGQLNQSVRRNAPRGQYAENNALLQQLSTNANSVLPATVPDSGTPLRGLMTGGVLTSGGLALGVDPITAAVVGGGVGLSAGAYTKPAQDLLNVIYRGTDMGGKLRALSEFRALAARNPALVPYLEQATQQLRGGAPSQSQPTAQPTGALPLPISP